jgi:hypothetical protein
MRVQITGSRDFTDGSLIKDILLDFVTDCFLNQEPLTIVHGGARGADRLASEAVRDVSWVNVEVHPANWAKYGKLAGSLRNVEMLDAGDPDLVLAFYKRGAKNIGTRNMVRECKLRGLTVEEYWEE